MSPALAGRFFTTEPPGKHQNHVQIMNLMFTQTSESKQFIDNNCNVYDQEKL